MTTLMALLPVAISGLVGAIAGFHYATKERERHEAELAKRRERQYEETQQYLPFANAAR
jgi:hypothetical protein